MILGIASDLPGVGQADGDTRINGKVEAGFGECRIARDWTARDRERDRRCALEREHSVRRDASERMLSRPRGARDQDHAVTDRHHAGEANAERRVAGLEARAAAATI